jgi:hypothetical protein
MPWGRAAPQAGADFGTLPASNLGIAAYVTSIDPRDFPDAATVPDNSSVAAPPKKKWYQYERPTAAKLGSPVIWFVGIMMVSTLLRTCENGSDAGGTTPARTTGAFTTARVEARPLPNFAGTTIVNLKELSAALPPPTAPEPGKQAAIEHTIPVQRNAVADALNPHHLKFGMTKAQIAAVMGPPAKTTTDLSGTHAMEFWTYPQAVHDQFGNALNRVLFFRDDQLTGWNDQPSVQNRPPPRTN